MPKLELLRRIDQRTGLLSADQVQTVIIGGANADMVDGIDASRIPRPNVLLALNANGQFPASAIPFPRADAQHGWGGRTIFGPGAAYLVEDVDASTTTWPVSDPVWTVGEYLLAQPPTQAGEKVKVTAGPTFAGPGRYEYTVIRNADGLGAHSFNRNQVVVSLGKAGQGYVAIDAQGHRNYRPFVEVIVRNSDSVSDHSIRARLGNLEGLWENGVETEIPKPSGSDIYGLWTDNGFFKGTVYIKGNSRITEELAVGYPLGPEMRVRRRALPNGQTVHGMEWLYEPNRRWWVQWFNETNKRVYWSIRKPQTSGSPEKELIRLIYRAGDPGKGEPAGNDYFLEVDATAIFGDLIAQRVRILGSLSVMAPDFGTMRKAVFEVANAEYSDTANRDGIYMWAGQDVGSLFTGTFGMEFFRTGTRQGRWRSDLGALMFGSNDRVALSGEGLQMIAADLSTVGDESENEESAVVWRQGSLSGRRSGFIYSYDNGGDSRILFLGMHRDLGDPKEDTINIGFHFPSGAIAPVIQIFDDGGFGSFLLANVNRVDFPGTRYENNRWNYNSDLYANSRLFVPLAATNLANRQFSAGKIANGSDTYHVLAWGTLDTDGETPVTNMIGIDPTNNRIVIKHGSGGWRYASTSAV